MFQTPLEKKHVCKSLGKYHVLNSRNFDTYLVTLLVTGKKNSTYRMYGIFAGIWYLAAGSKSLSERKNGGFIPEYFSLKIKFD